MAGCHFKRGRGIMARCKRCGVDTGYRGNKICFTCMKAWKDKRLKAFNQAESELGTLNAENLKAIQKRVKVIEKGL